jgi:hypothetical protein
MAAPLPPGASDESKRQWRIECLLEQEVILLRQILARLPAAPQYFPTTGIAVVAGVPDS